MSVRRSKQRGTEGVYGNLLQVSVLVELQETTRRGKSLEVNFLVRAP